jgi:cadmium resistance protein CadD (predicted permease)
MADVDRVLLTAGVLWTSTNVDNLVVLTVLFSQSAQCGSPRTSQVVIGQYVGSVIIIVVSVVAAAGLLVVPDKWVGLLGLVPLTLGVYGLVKAFRPRVAALTQVHLRVGSVASVVVANGGDNIGVYTTAFRTFSITETVITIGSFLVLIAVWCAIAWFAATRKRVLTALKFVSRWLVPVVYVTIGLLIVFGSGLLGRLGRGG